MKKLFIALVAVFTLGTANAQIQDLGVRLGGGQGFGAELSAMWGLGGNRLETDLGWHSDDGFTGIEFTGIYQWKGDIGSGFNWFAGVGARLAMWSYDAAGADDDFALALAGQAGIEYNFDAIPIQLTLDIRPCFWLIPDTDFHWGDIALGIRYRF
jgi:hypothetical protein